MSYLRSRLIGEVEAPLLPCRPMAVTSTSLDGNNVALTFAGSVSANVFTLNLTTGAVTSSYLPTTWCSVLRQNALKLFRVTTLSQRQTVQFLDRLIALGSIDGTTIATTASVGAGTATLVVAVSADTAVLVQLPHSMFGAASLGQSVPATGGGGGGGVVAGDLGLALWTGAVDGAVVPGDLVAVEVGTGILVRADRSNGNRMPAVGTYALDSALSPAYRVAGPASVSGGPFAAGAVLFAASTPGQATTTESVIAGEINQRVGTADSAGALNFKSELMVVV